MIPNFYYHIFYLLLVSVLSVFAFSRYPWLSDYEEIRKIEHGSRFTFVEIVLVVFLALFIGLRDPHDRIFGDTWMYTFFYEKGFGQFFSWDWNTDNKLFDNIYYYMSSWSSSANDFYVLVAFIYFGGIWYATKKIFPNNSLSALLVYLAAFSTYSYAVNGFKSGAAAAIFLVALAINNSDRNKKILCGLLLLCSWGFHHSMIVPVLAFCLCKFVKNPRIYIIGWVACLIIAALHITFFQQLFAGIGDDLGDKQAVGYLENEWEKESQLGITGFRIDFIIYSIVPLITGWIAINRKYVESESFKFLLNLYTLVNSFWLLCIYASYTNRIAYLSWLIYPIVLIYPFLRGNWGDNRYAVFKFVAYGHLFFTLFMTFVYYA